MSSADVRQLVHRAQGGDADAVALLYQNYAQAIYRYVVYRVPSTADAEDLTAEVFVKMVEGLPAYRFTGAPFEAWLYSIASARVIDYYRRARRRPQTELSELMRDAAPFPEDQVQHDEELDALRSAVQQLSDEHQSILILRFVERKSHEEVAIILGKTVGAVKSAQHRALDQLANLLGSERRVRHYLRGTHD